MIFKKQYSIIYLSFFIGFILPIQAYIFKAEKNNIKLTVIDYADKSDAILFYAHGKPITAKSFMQKGEHPLRVIVENKNNKSIAINKRSVWLEMSDYWVRRIVSEAFAPVEKFLAELIFGSFTIVIPASIHKELNNYKATLLSIIGFIALEYAMVKLVDLWQYYKIAEEKVIEDHTLHSKSFIIIEPGKKAEKYILVRGEAYRQTFSFHIFDKHFGKEDGREKEVKITATFDVDLRTA